MRMSLRKALGWQMAARISIYGKDGMIDEEVAVNVEGIEDKEEVVNAGVEGGVVVEVAVVRIDAANIDEIEKDDVIVALNVGDDVVPHRLISAKAMGRY